MVEAYYNGGLKGAACDGKEAFADRAIAAKVAKRKGRQHGTLNVYRCKFCHQWHVGNRLK